ncbi:RodZ domain-containing protein [Deinococcus cellulosilyticus]|uniref:DUF4115 domain-containing protein n=1 Tax=Deinococcus cellulosilyticus (strain DSM 18568 / NBRC 106333 / KACC 11606 / 5516J-15) TaxID=1223518 RepID=A0A511N2H9_DEIC1|nr:RodZ domain-containing protein [Deinococcus cellulosilyticus]GEM47069.1 hypothetical protein DC3_27040 [Deinococcus cellulosilyticus NBRC 106333 = KACC 11606]
MNSLGEHLRRARLNTNLDLVELAERTKIRSEYLTALEDMDFERLPERLFTRAYLQRYAVELGLNPEPLLQQYDQMFPPVEIKIPSSMSGGTERLFPWGLVTSVFSVLLVLGGLGWWLYAAWQAGPNVGLQEAVQEVAPIQTARTVQFSLTTSPSGAKVYLDNGLVGITPIRSFPVTQKPEAELRVELDGYLAYREKLSLSRNTNLSVALSPRPLPDLKIQAEVVGETLKQQTSNVKPNDVKPGDTKPATSDKTARTPEKAQTPKKAPEASEKKIEVAASDETPTMADVIRGVQLRFEGKSWTRVKDSQGKVLYEGTPGKGQKLSFEGPVVIRTGSAGLVWVQLADGSEQRMGVVGRVVERAFP